MEDQTKDVVTTSRRSFSKSVAAALITAPFALSSVRGQERRAIRGQCQPTPLSPLLRTPCSHLGTPQSEPHEPPIGVGGGSLTMECEERMHREGSVNTPPRRYLYDFENYTYGQMRRLEVVTEYESVFTYHCYKLNVAGVTSPKLMIWLQRLRKLGEGEEGGYPWIESDIDPTTEPHVFFTYRPTDTQEAFEGAVIESDKKFGDIKKGFKGGETFKHKHEGYGKTRFRIGRWRIINGDGSVLAGDCAGRRLVQNPEKPEESVDVEIFGFHLRPRFEHLGQLLRSRQGRRP
jgi:hypothetical protein